MDKGDIFMAEKIFISYNHNDELIVDNITRRLELEFGRNNIFYDKWSVQPGDSIIGKMNEGLESFTTFFFFVSANSLKSNMVKLEWQTALNKAVNNDLKFVAIRLDNCSVPAIISDKLYIDLLGEGMDDTVEKMRCIIKGESTYKPQENIENIKAYFKKLDDYKYRITIKAHYFSEHNTQFAFGCENPLEDFSIDVKSEPMVMTNTGTLTFEDGQVLNMRTVGLQRALSPNYPLVVEANINNKKSLRSFCVYLLIDRTNGAYRQITVLEEA